MLSQRPCSPLLSALTSPFLSSRSSSVPLKPLRMTPENNWKSRSVRHRTSNLLFKKGMGERAIEERLKKESFFGGCAAHWYDNLIFWAMVWSSLRGHPSIIRPVTSSLSSSSAPTIYYVCVIISWCMCVSKYMCFALCVCVCGWMCVSIPGRLSPEFPIRDHMRGNVKSEQLSAWQRSSPTKRDRNLASISTPTFNTAEDRVYAGCVCVSASITIHIVSNY